MPEAIRPYVVPGWHRDAACSGSDLDFTTSNMTDAHQAMVVCHSCPVIALCAREALELRVSGEVRAGCYIPGYFSATKRQILHQLRKRAGLIEAPEVANGHSTNQRKRRKTI